MDFFIENEILTKYIHSMMDEFGIIFFSFSMTSIVNEIIIANVLSISVLTCKRRASMSVFDFFYCDDDESR